jgi:hypothetical protein
MALWLTEAYADSYFDTRYGASTHWVSGIDKIAVLTTAQQDIEGCPDYAFDDVSESAPADQAMKDAVCEQALFRLMDADIDIRQATKAQGVVQQGAIQETYTGGGEVPIAPKAKQLLRPYLATGNGNSFLWAR